MTTILPAVAGFLARPHQLWIGGQWVAAQSGARMDTLNPATGQPLASVALGDGADIDAAARAARKAFESGPWVKMLPNQRGRLLWKIAELIEARGEIFAQIEALDNGKPATQARDIDVAVAAKCLRYYAGWCDKIEGRTPNVSMPSTHAYVRREPVGVCGLIVPWNFPLLMAMWKIAPCLAAGNTAILKPAEETPLSALYLAELMAEAGLPDGVFNVVTGLGHTAGAALAAHMDVDKIAFTGSTEVGRLILAAAAGNLKKVSLELGGKSPNVVLADANLKRAIAGSAEAIFYNSGQVCTAGSRLYAHKSVFDQVVRGIADEAAKMKVLPGLDPASDMGPLISEKQFARVRGMVAGGLAEGATLAAGGKPVGNQGWFLEPTILVDTRPDMSVAREEIFGPVLVAAPFDDLDDLVRQANDSAFGLAASVWTRDLSAAHKLAAAIKAGTVWVNCQGPMDPAMPFGGYKQSGWGREYGFEGLDQYTQLKSVFARL